ncbi:MAG: hypothetical protein ABIR32_08555 [Ilumatobacteraceae bacterium]
MASWFRSLWSGGTRPSDPSGTNTRPAPAKRPAGPTSAHLWFGDVPPGPWRSVSATLEVLTEPTSEHLYFWALQASFTDRSNTTFGAAHTGLQWNPRHPGNRAVNWGGYRAAADVRSVLDGSRSLLPGIAGDENTRNYPWRAGTGYRFTIDRSELGWRSRVTDTTTGEPTMIRDLFAPGDQLAGFVVWMEIFAPCDAPPTVARWSDLELTDADRGAHHRIGSVRTSFPDAPGNCTNNDSRRDPDRPDGWLQLTNDRRTTNTATAITIG